MEGTLPHFMHADDAVSTAQALGVGSDGVVRLPQSLSDAALLKADFSRSGPDLLLKTQEGTDYVVPGYFQEEALPRLEGYNGTVVTPKVVAALVGPLAPGQIAQTAPDGAAQQGIGLGEPIGQVSEAEGTVNVTHPDGTKGTLAIGDNIYQGDVLETGPTGSVGVVFVDDTIFSLSNSGRMVMDEMVYDPGTQTGAFNAVVVQGVFSFVSGKIAKTSPEGMQVATPTGNIGIRGSTVLGKAAEEGSENTITLVQDVDGNVGEIIITNAAGTLVLNQAGASTTLFSALAPPSPVVIFSPQDIQQNFGQSLTRLVKVVAKKAQADAQRAEQKAQQSTEEAQKANSEAQQAGRDAERADEQAQQTDEQAAQAEAEAEAAAAEAAAAQAEAEATGNEVAAAKAAAAAAQAAAAAAKAAEAKAQAEAQAQIAAQARAEAAAKAEAAANKAAEAQAATQQAQQAQQFNAMADTAFVAQAQAFDQFQQSQPQQNQPLSNSPAGPGDQGTGLAEKAGTVNTADRAGTAGGEPPPDGDAAAKAAYEQAIAAGASPEEAFNAAAMAASGGNMDDPAVAIARAAFEDAIASGASPQDAMFAATTAVNQFDAQQGGFSPNQPQPYGAFDPNAPLQMNPFNPDALAGTYMNTTFYDPMMAGYGGPAMGGYYDPAMDGFLGPYLDFFNQLGATFTIYNPLEYDPYAGLYNNFYFDPFADVQLTANFSETIIAPAAGGSMVGGGLNSNFYFHWGAINSGAVYGISDSGGTDQISFDALDLVTAKVTFGATGTSGTIDIYNDITATNHYATVTFSGIEQFLLSDINVSGFSLTNYTSAPGGDVLVLPTMTGGKTGYVIAGSSGANTFDLNYAMDGAIVFGKGGGDTFNIDADVNHGGITVIGGITATTDNVDASLSDGIPDQHLNVFDYSSTTTTPLFISMNGQGSDMGGDVLVRDSLTNATFDHDLWDVGSFTASTGVDNFVINSGNYNTINASDGNDNVVLYIGTRYASLNGGAGTDTLTIKSYNGGTIDLSSGAVVNFESVVLNASSSLGGVTFTGMNISSSVTGSNYNDTFTGGTAADSMAGGSGADTFKYTATNQLGDAITDFVAGTDKFNFSDAAFGSIGVGTLAAGNFISGAGAVASTATEYFVFNTTTSILSYDADGSNGGTAVTVADLSGISGILTASDIVIV